MMSLLDDAKNLDLLQRYERTWPKLVDRAHGAENTRVRLDIEGEAFTLVLLDEAAPRTCEAFLRSLPHDGLMIHAAWSGDAIRELEAFELAVPEFENATYYPAPGDVVYTVGHGEFSIIYGDCSPNMPSGRVRETVFAILADRLRDFQRVGRLVRVTGAKTFRLTQSSGIVAA